MWSTKRAATDLKEVATLYVVVIGNNVNERQAKKWPSYPEEVHTQMLFLCSLSVLAASRGISKRRTTLGANLRVGKASERI